MSINDYENRYESVNQRKTIENNDVNNYYHNHYIDNLDNAGNVNDGNDKGVKEDYYGE